MIKSYVQMYLVLCIMIYFIGLGIDFIVYILKNYLLGQVWYSLKTTNLDIIHWTGRRYSFFKKILYRIPIISEILGLNYINLWEDLSEYGLKRDKLYYIISLVLRWIWSVIGFNKRNIATVLLVVVCINHELITKIMNSLYKYLMKADKYKINTVINRINSIIQSTTLESAKSFLIITLLLIVIAAIINLFLSARVKYIRDFELIWLKQNEDKVSEIAVLQGEIFEMLVQLRNGLETNIYELTKIIRRIDYYLNKKGEYYFKIGGKNIVDKMEDCKEIFEEIKDKISKIEEMKGVEIYKQYNKQFIDDIWGLSLNDSKKEAWKTLGVLENKEYILSVLLPNEFPHNEKNCGSGKFLRMEIDYDENFAKETRIELYGHLRNYVEYYNSLTSYLVKINKRRKKIRKKIYTKKQLKIIREQLEQAKDYLG